MPAVEATAREGSVLQRTIAAIAVLISTWSVAQASGPLVDRVTLVGDASVANLPLPTDPQGNSAATFTVAQSGSYTIAVTDLAQPAALGSLQVSVASSTGSVAKFQGAGSQTVTLSANTTYTVQPLASAAAGEPGGTLSVSVQQGAAPPVWQDEWVVSAASTPQAGESVFAESFTIVANDTFTLTVNDLAFPAPLQSILVEIFDAAGNQVAGPYTTPGSFPLAGLQVGSSYYLYAVACAAAGCAQAGSGLYGVQIAGASPGNVVCANTVCANTESVGNLPPAKSVPVANAGTVSLQLKDLGWPAALQSFQAVVAQGASSLQSISAPGPYSFMAGAGSLQLYVLATPGAGGMSAYAEYATENGTTLVDTAQPVLDSSHYGYVFAASTPSKPIAAGSVQLQVNDYNEPSAFSSLSARAVQAGDSVASSTVQGSGNASSFSVQAGALTLLVFPELQSGQNGLFGMVLVSVPPANNPTLPLNITQGVGALFNSQSVPISVTGHYTITATDLGFPASFSNLLFIVTNGQSVVGQIFAAGNTSFAVNTAGNYVINVLSQVGNGQHFGQYGIQLEQSPPPTTSLSASPTSVSAGGTTKLTWSSTNASSCTASGGGWSGNLATSGSQQSPPISANTLFTITCTGDGGPASASVEVTVTKQSGSGGGGLDGQTLLGLCLLALWKLVLRRSTARQSAAR
jgi:hypothetical protein